MYDFDGFNGMNYDTDGDGIADAYAEQVLASLESTLTQHQQLVKNGQIYMEKLRAESTGNYDPLKRNFPQQENTEDDFKIE